MKTQLYWQELFALPVENLLFPVISKLFPASKPPAPMNHAKIFKGWPSQDASWELVPRWYKSFPPGRFLAEMQKPTSHYVE